MHRISINLNIWKGLRVCYHVIERSLGTKEKLTQMLIFKGPSFKFNVSTNFVFTWKSKVWFWWGYTWCVWHNTMAKSLFKDKAECCQFKLVLVLPYFHCLPCVWVSAFQCGALGNAVCHGSLYMAHVEQVPAFQSCREGTEVRNCCGLTVIT